ncbi:hypothetical protein A9G44_04465 [Gilliamella sp. Occ4-3]|nr:hypothetical protein A9G44_04465 [Gilliamella apicola]
MIDITLKIIILYTVLIGLCYQMKQIPKKVKWLGLGPHENYPDRKTSAIFGDWSLPFAELYLSM